MAVGSNVSSWLQHIQKALHQVTFKMKVVVLPKPWTTTCLVSHPIKQGLIDAFELD